MHFHARAEVDALAKVAALSKLMHFHGRVGGWLRILALMCILRLSYLLRPVSLSFYDHFRLYVIERQEGKFRLGLRAIFSPRNMLRKDTE